MYYPCRSVYYPGVCTIQEYVLSRSVCYPGVCTIQECVLSRSMYYPGVCTIQECVLSRSVYYPGVCTIHAGVCTIQECVLSRSMYYPGVCTIQECVLSRSVYYPGVCTIQEYVLSMQECVLSRTTVYALIFRHSNYLSWAPKGMKSILIDDEIACVLILRQRPYLFVTQAGRLHSDICCAINILEKLLFLRLYSSFLFCSSNCRIRIAKFLVYVVSSNGCNNSQARNGHFSMVLICRRRF